MADAEDGAAEDAAQAANLTDIGNRIRAGIVGVANATIAYDQSQLDMASTFQAATVRAADTGDLAYFAQFGNPG